MAALLLPSLHPNSSVASHSCARDSKKLVGKTRGPAVSFRKTTWPEFTRNGLWRKGICSHFSTTEKSSPSTASLPNELPRIFQSNGRCLKQKMEGTVVIAGAGPAGCLMAHYMLRRGFSVQLFQKREAANLGDSYEQIYSRDDIRSFPLTITTRALKPLDAAEFKLPTTLARRLKGKYVVLLLGGKPELLEVHYDLLIGADGANSAVRKEIVRLDQLQTSNESRRNHLFYQDLNRIQGWARIDMLLVGMADGSFWGGFTSPKLVNESNPETVRSILREEAPEVLELVLEEDSNWCENFVAQPSINGGKAVILSRFHKGNIIVIGDAAHSTFPVYGTGCHAALEDCAILDKILNNLLKEVKTPNRDFLPPPDSPLFPNPPSSSSPSSSSSSATSTIQPGRGYVTSGSYMHTIVNLNVTRELFSNTKLDFFQISFFKALHVWFSKVIQRPAGQCLSGATRFSSIRKLRQRQNLIFYSFLIVLALALGFTAY